MLSADAVVKIHLICSNRTILVHGQCCAGVMALLCALKRQIGYHLSERAQYTSLCLVDLISTISRGAAHTSPILWIMITEPVHV